MCALSAARQRNGSLSGRPKDATWPASALVPAGLAGLACSERIELTRIAVCPSTCLAESALRRAKKFTSPEIKDRSWSFLFCFVSSSATLFIIHCLSRVFLSRSLYRLRRLAMASGGASSKNGIDRFLEARAPRLLIG